MPAEDPLQVLAAVEILYGQQVAEWLSNNPGCTPSPDVRKNRVAAKAFLMKLLENPLFIKPIAYCQHVLLHVRARVHW